MRYNGLQGSILFFRLNLFLFNLFSVQVTSFFLLKNKMNLAAFGLLNWPHVSGEEGQCLK